MDKNMKSSGYSMKGQGASYIYAQNVPSIGNSVAKQISDQNKLEKTKQNFRGRQYQDRDFPANEQSL